MDINRFKKAQIDANAKIDQNKIWAQEFSETTTNNWLNYVLSLVDKIKDRHLDNLISEKIANSPNSDSLVIYQIINSPSIFYSYAYYTCMITYNREDFHNCDLWKNRVVEYKYNKDFKLLYDNIENPEYTKDAGHNLGFNATDKYVNSQIAPKIHSRLEKYGLTILNETFVEGKLVIVVKNPIA